MKLENTYTKHYYIGSQRVSSALGTTFRLGFFPNQANNFFSDLTVMEDFRDVANAKVHTATAALSATYSAMNQSIALPNPAVEGGVDTLPFDSNLYDAYFYHSDHLGSSNYISNNTGIVSQHTEYLPFGETFVDEHLNSHNTPFKFNAKELDDETGNYYYGARYYNPKWSTWLSVDPLVEETMDAYGYCYQNPINLIDPDGKNPKPPKYAYLALSLGVIFNFRPQNVKLFRSFVSTVYSTTGGATNLLNAISSSVGYTSKEEKLNLFQSYSTAPNDNKFINTPNFFSTTANKKIMFLAIFGHGGNDIWGSGAYISKNDMAPLRTMINDGKISFHEDALIYMGTCNSGTNSGSGSFAQEIADLTGVAVIAMMNDGVAPTGNERSEDTMTYGPKLGKSGPGNFYRFEKGKDPVLIGKEVDVIQLIDQQRELENKEQ